MTKAKNILYAATFLSSLAASAAAAPLITATVSDSETVRVAGEKSPLLARTTDRGELAPAQMLPHAMLVLKRTPQQQAAFDTLVHAQQVKSSPLYHRWLTPAQLRAYGPDQADIAKIVAWLQSHGLTVNEVAPSGMSIDFGGTAQAIATAFGTSLHQVTLANGEAHVANITDLTIPAALAPVVRGPTLSNFFPKPNMVKATAPAVRKRSAMARGVTPQDDVESYEAVTPQDFNIIYNVNPLLTGAAPGGQFTGAGVTVAVVEQTDIMAADWHSFRTAFGLNSYKGKLEFQHPGCTDPGYTPDEGEAALDAEWIGVAAPGATVLEASCPGSTITFGVEVTLQHLVEHGTQATVFSISYGGPEQTNSPAFLALWSNLIEEADSEGISVFISSGDSGVSYDRNAIAQDGLAVNGLSSNPYNTTVGGTDFLDTYQSKIGVYWRPGNVARFSSAKSYIPETPWDNSCAGALITRYSGYATAIDSCNDVNNPNGFQNGVGGTGGESMIYAKPDFQNNGVPGMPADGMRDQPDVSLFASNGFWGHFLVLCMSDTNEGGTTCDYTNANDVFANAAGGTSFAAPAFAGIAALLVEKNGPLGNATPRLYDLAKTQFTSTPTAAQCISGKGRAADPSCVFYNVTYGNIAEPCYATTGDCFSTQAAAPEGIGVLRGTDMPNKDAYPAQQGYSLATGLGSVNVTNLINAY